MLKRNSCFKILLFTIIFFVLLLFVQRLFRVPEERIPETWTSFENLQENSLDAVYIGSSTTYCLWQPTTAWENYGYAVFPLAMPSVRPQSLKYLIIEAQKTQADPLFIINLNTFKTTQVSSSHAHKAIDYMPFSWNKLAMIRALMPYTYGNGTEKLEYYFPIVRFHSEWPNLSLSSLFNIDTGYMGAVRSANYLSDTMDLSEIYTEDESVLPMTKDQNEILSDLLSFCSQEDLNVLFVVIPQADPEAESIARLNGICQTVSEAGFPVLNLRGKADELCLDLANDFYDEKHTNIHGSLKYTSYLCDYLREHYHFADKRGEESYHCWDDAATLWKQTVSPYYLDLEVSYSPRDNHLAAPELKSVSVSDAGAVIEWIPAEGAELTKIYRNDGLSWTCIAETDISTGSFTDTEVSAGHTYSYTAICGRRDADEIIFGNCDYSGISVDIPA